MGFNSGFKGLIFFLDDCCPGWIVTTRTTDSHVKRIILVSTNCCIHMVVPPDDETRYPET